MITITKPATKQVSKTILDQMQKDGWFRDTSKRRFDFPLPGNPILCGSHNCDCSS